MNIKRAIYHGTILLLLLCIPTDKTSYTAYSWPPKVVDKAIKSTSVIFVEYDTKGGLGAGVIVSEDGKTLTAAHVVLPDNYKKITMITANGNEYDIRVLAMNRRSDLALVEPVASAQKFIYSRLQPSNDLHIGQDILVVGHPYSEVWTVTSGIICRLPFSLWYFCNVMEIDAVINPGNSGGPVFNTKGEIVGIVSAMRMSVFGPTGIGIAIPAKEIRLFLEAYTTKNEASQQRKRYNLGTIKEN